MIRESTTQICGRTYSITTHPTDEGLRLMFGIGKLLPQKVLQLILMAKDESAETLQALRDPEVMAGLLASVYRYASDESHTAIHDAFKYCTVHPLPFGKAMAGSAYEHYDALYSGNYGELVDAMIWILVENFKQPSASKVDQSSAGTDTPSSEGHIGESTPTVSVRVSSPSA